MNKTIIPELCRSTARKNVIVDIEAWKNFAQRITKNQFVKAFLLQRDGTKCSWCHKDIHEIKIIHHTTYDHCCSYNVVIRIPSPTYKHRNKTRVVPDCKSCKENSIERFINCMDKLVLVHSNCNKSISELAYSKK